MNDIYEILNNKNFNQFLEYLQNTKNISSLVQLFNNDKIYESFLQQQTKYMPENSTNYYRLMLLKNNVISSNDLPKCKYCGKLLEDKDIRKYFKNGFCFCSQNCYRLFPKSEKTHQKLSEHMFHQWSIRDAEYKKNFYEKVAQTNLEKYNTKCTLNTKENIFKKKNTWKLKYGVDNPLKAQSIKEKVYNTNIERYGSICPLNNKLIKDKAKQTLFNNYGVYNPMQSKNIIAKMRQNALLKYGTKWPTKNEDSWKKYCATMDSENFVMPKYHKYHTYTYKSGKKIIVQGYEDIALDHYILKNYNEDDIENSITFMYSLHIIYKSNDGEEHKYIPDFYIKSENLIIEVKSNFTFYIDLDKIERKCKAAIDNGYNIQILVFEHIDRKKLNINYKLYNYEDVKIEKEKYYHK